jgi:hypothetical protein
VVALLQVICACPCLCLAAAAACFQDWGARDPTPGEIGSNFGEKIVMNWDTEHIIK